MMLNMLTYIRHIKLIRGNLARIPLKHNHTHTHTHAEDEERCLAKLFIRYKLVKRPGQKFKFPTVNKSVEIFKTKRYCTVMAPLFAQSGCF